MSGRTALVLGGGFAGLSAAIHLSLAGYEVTLLEGADQFGGKAGELREAGFRFDTGPSVFTLPGVIGAIFGAAGESLPFELRPLELLCRYLYPSGRVWDVYQDVEKTVAQLSPAEALTYRQLLDEARKLYEAASPTFVFGAAPGPLELIRYGLRHGLSAHPTKTLEQLLDGYSARGDLKQFFLRFATYFGADPYRAPAVLHNIAWSELGLGVSYPEGGIYRVVESLVGLAQRSGVTLRSGMKVERLELTGNRLTHVHAGGESLSADVIISTLDIVRTHQLLGKKAGLERREPSLSGFVLLLGLEGETPKLEHHTISFSKDYRAEFRAIREGRFPDDPTLYFNVSSKTEPADAPPGFENWFVMANAPATGKSEADEAVYQEHLLEVLARRGFDTTGRLKVKKVLGPQYLAGLAHRGSIYGAAPHSLLQTLRPHQRIKGIENLYLAGGSVFPGGGIPLALLSGKAAANLVGKGNA